MERVLVVHVGVPEMAEAVALVLQDRGMLPDVQRADSVEDVREYDGVILGAVVRKGRWHKDAGRFAKRFAGDLVMTPVWAFSSGPLDDSAERHVIPPVPSAAKAMARLDARGHMTFGGWAPEVRRRFRRSAAGADFRNFERVAAWADDIAIELATPALHLLAV